MNANVAAPELTGTGFFQLPRETIWPLWPQIRPHAMSAIDRSSGKWDEHSVSEFLINFLWQIWAYVEDGALVAIVITRIETFPSGLKVLMVETATGERREAWQHLAIDRLKEFAKGEGCGLMTLIARPGWERVFREFEKTHVILELKL